MNKHIIIFSGLFGLLTPNTLIPDYKLKMNVLSLKKLWGPIITEHLSKEELINYYERQEYYTNRL